MLVALAIGCVIVAFVVGFVIGVIACDWLMHNDFEVPRGW